MSPMVEKLPAHLRKYVASQNYELYTAEEQATWRYILLQLKKFLKEAAHPCYEDGLKKTGVFTDHIPKISEMDDLLQKFGWGAVPVSGFIPPAAFMEFQSLGILPIACDMRSLDHLLYTPAPDIVHEAAGHAPILIHPEYAEYLKSYAQVAKKAIISKEDLDQYEAIRKLSDIKEHPQSTKDQINEASTQLQKINESMTFVSEASLLSRMNWWTAEYGLIGDLKGPKIYGAGLLSSLGESREYLKDHVKKIPLDVGCVEVSYDITEPQPQLFVTPSFSHLHKVLEELSERLSYKTGGVAGLSEALRAKSVNTVELDSGIQISGVLESFSELNTVHFLKFSGPCQLGYQGLQLQGHSRDHHSQGYSTPLGTIQSFNKDLSSFSNEELKRIGCFEGNIANISFQSGITLTGKFIGLIKKNDRPLVLSFEDCLVKNGDQVLFDPSWGSFDMACGNQVTSVFGGPADREAYGDLVDFSAAKVPVKKFSPAQESLFSVYSNHRAQRRLKTMTSDELKQTWQEFHSLHFKTWLAGLEVIELAYLFNQSELAGSFASELLELYPAFRNEILDGVRLAKTQ